MMLRGGSTFLAVKICDNHRADLENQLQESWQAIRFTPQSLPNESLD